MFSISVHPSTLFISSSLPPFPWMTHVGPLSKASRGCTNPASSSKAWLVMLQRLPGLHHWQVALASWRTSSSPQALGYVHLNLPTGMFHNSPAGKSVGAKRKVRGLQEWVDWRSWGEWDDISNTWGKIIEANTLLFCQKEEKIRLD